MSYKSELKAVEMSALQLMSAPRQNRDLLKYDSWADYCRSICRRSARLSYKDLSLASHYLGCIGKWSYNKDFRQSMRAVKKYLLLVRDDRMSPDFGVIRLEILKGLGFRI